MLDQQIIHNRNQSLFNLAFWLSKKYAQAKQKRSKIRAELANVRKGGEVGLTDGELREEHRKQVVAQTKPLPRKHEPLSHDLFADLGRPGQDKNAGKKAIEVVLEMERAIDKIADELAEVMKKVDLVDTIEGVAELETQRQGLFEMETRYRERIGRLMAQLGVQERTEVIKLKNDKFVKLRVNAFALLSRVRQKMRSRRFELDRLERSFRTAVNGAFAF